MLVLVRQYEPPLCVCEVQRPDGDDHPRRPEPRDRGADVVREEHGASIHERGPPTASQRDQAGGRCREDEQGGDGR